MNIKNSISIFFPLVFIFNSCAVDPQRQKIDCKIAIDKKYEIAITKEKLINQFSTNPTFIDIESESNNNILYFDISIPTHSSVIEFKTSTFQKNKDTLSLSLDSIVNCRISGDFLTGIDHENVNFCKNLTPNDYIKYFENEVIQRITSTKDSENKNVVINFMY